MPRLRNTAGQLEQNPITRIALPRIGRDDIIPLWFGEGDAVTDADIRDAAKAALDAGETFYVDPRGTSAVRNAVRDYLWRIYGVDVEYERITVPGSAMLSITIAAQLVLEPGSHALIVGPAWPNVYNSFRVTGAGVDYVRKRVENGRWQLDMDELEAAVRPSTRVIFVNSPCNPTGWVMPAAQQQRLLEFCRAREILVLADEVYHRHVYSEEIAPSFLSLAEPDDAVIVINSLSKAWAMTGWRLGWMVAPVRCRVALAALAECFNTGATVFAQAGAVHALRHGEDVVQRLRRQYAEARRITGDLLGGHPRLELPAVEGGFYAFPRIPGMRDSFRFAERLADEAGVGVAAGFGFGPGNEAHFRICFARSHEPLREALLRVAEFVNDWEE